MRNYCAYGGEIQEAVTGLMGENYCREHCGKINSDDPNRRYYIHHEKLKPVCVATYKAIQKRRAADVHKSQA